MPRLNPVPRDQATSEMKALYDRWFGVGRDPVTQPGTSTGVPGNWWTIWAHAPDVLQAMRSYYYADAPIDPALRELALVRTGYARGSHFVFSQHCKAARKAGVAEAKIKAAPYWTISDAYTPLERAVLAYVDGLVLEGGRVHDEVFAVLRQTFTDNEILILTYLINLYNMHGISSKALCLEYDDVPERVVELPVPDGGGVQNWRDPK